MTEAVTDRLAEDCVMDGSAPALASSRLAEQVASRRDVYLRFAATVTSIDAAEDVVQAALEQAWAHREKFDESRGSLDAWILGIISHQRRPWWRSLRGSGVDLAGVGLELDEASRTETPVDVRRVIRKLPTPIRECVVLFYYVDLPTSTISELLGCRVGTVKARLSKGRSLISSALGSDYGID